MSDKDAKIIQLESKNADLLVAMDVLTTEIHNLSQKLRAQEGTAQVNRTVLERMALDDAIVHFRPNTFPEETSISDKNPPHRTTSTASNIPLLLLAYESDISIPRTLSPIPPESSSPIRKHTQSKAVSHGSKTENSTKLARPKSPAKAFIRL